MDAECTVESLGEMVHAHPTPAEQLRKLCSGEHGNDTLLVWFLLGVAVYNMALLCHPAFPLI